MSFKTKTLLFVSVSLGIFAFLFGLFFYWQQNQKLHEAQQAYFHTVNSTFTKILEKQNKFYEARAKANISSDGVKEAIQYKDRKGLQELSKGRWKTLKSSNQFLFAMNFYLSDGTVLLRMHRSDEFDDNAAIHSIVNSAITTQKALHGFELERDHVAYRSISPVFDQNHYVGALEFISRSDEIFSEMEYISGLKGALFVKTPVDINGSQYRYKGYSLQYSTINNGEIADRLVKNDYNFEVFKQCNVGDKTYLVYSFDINNFEGKCVGKAVFFNDITAIQDDFYKGLVEMYTFLLLLLGVLVVGIHWGFHKIISKLDESIHESQNVHKEMVDYLELIDQNVITSTTDLKGIIISVSSAFCAISGYSKAELMGKNHQIIRHPDTPPLFYRSMWATLSNGGIWRGEIKNLKKNGDYYWVEMTIHPVFDEKKNKTGYTAIRHDITDKKRIEEISITDSLTGVYNRRYFDQIFPRFVSTAKRNNDTVCFYMIDVDYFKLYNDHYGHQAGDVVLIQVAQAIQNILKRSDDYCFRIGGEEFALLIRVTEANGICDFGEKLRQKIEELKIPHENNLTSRFVTISMGQYCEKGMNIDNENMMYKCADDLLYKAKAAGRNQVKCNPVFS